MAQHQPSLCKPHFVASIYMFMHCWWKWTLFANNKRPWTLEVESIVDALERQHYPRTFIVIPRRACEKERGVRHESRQRPLCLLPTFKVYQTLVGGLCVRWAQALLRTSVRENYKRDAGIATWLNIGETGRKESTNGILLKQLMQRVLKRGLLDTAGQVDIALT